MFVDWITMLENIANSLVQVLDLVLGACYLMGLGLMISGIMELKILGMGKSMHATQKHGGFFKLISGVLLLFLPSTLQVMTASFFGVGQILSYNPNPSQNLYSAIKILMQVAGIIWFARGSMMLLEVSEPGKYKSYISMMYIFAGVCAINLDYFIASLTYSLNRLIAIF